jgi:hypothetical protein
MEASDYYDGLSPHHDTRLIVLVESLCYCESENAEWIKRSELMKRSNAMLHHFTGIKLLNFGGAFGRAIKKLSEQGFIRVEKRGPKDVRIYPNSKLIRRELERTKKRNMSESLSFLRIAHKCDQLNRRPPHLVESVSVSDSARLAVTKAQP